MLLLVVYSARGIISDFSWGGGGGRDGLASEASLISRGVRGGRGRAVSPLKKIVLILSYFMCFLKPHKQLISAKINSSKAGDPLKTNFLSLASVPWLWPCLNHTRTKKKKKKMQRRPL